MFGGNQNGQEALGTVLSDTQIKSMLEGKKTFVKGLKGKKGSYDAYLIQEGIEDYNYTKDGRKIKGSQYKVKLEFSKECYIMATKSANLYARIEPDVKEQAESILSALGIPASNAINMFYKQIILNRGLPFEVKIPTTKPVNVAELTEAELNAELEEGYADMVAGRTKPARQAFADIRKDYGI